MYPDWQGVSMTSKIGIVFMVLGLCAASVAQPSDWNVSCKTDSLHVDIPREAPVKINYVRFLSDEQGSRSALYFQNITEKPIREMILLLEFRRDSDYLLTEIVR